MPRKRWKTTAGPPPSCDAGRCHSRAAMDATQRARSAALSVAQRRILSVSAEASTASSLRAARCCVDATGAMRDEAPSRAARKREMLPSCCAKASAAAASRFAAVSPATGGANAVLRCDAVRDAERGAEKTPALRNTEAPPGAEGVAKTADPGARGEDITEGAPKREWLREGEANDGAGLPYLPPPFLAEAAPCEACGCSCSSGCDSGASCCSTTGARPWSYSTALMTPRTPSTRVSAASAAVASCAAAFAATISW